MAGSQDKECKVWAKGEMCISPYSGDGKLYKAVIEKIHRSPTGDVTALVKFDGYSDEEEVDVVRLQKVKAKGSDATKRRSKNSSTSGLFKPLTGGEADDRLKEKYGGLEEQTILKSEKLSASLFSNKKAAVASTSKGSNSQGKEKKKGIVAIGGEAVSISKQSGSGLPSNRKRLGAKLSEPNWVSDDDGDDDEQPVKTVQKKKKGIVVTGGEAVDKAKELPTSRKLSDISSILDPKSVSEALKMDHEPADLENKENISVINGFDEDDLEKPKFNFKPEGAKVPFILSEKGQEPIVQVPGTINQYLRDYQRDGIKFLYSHYTYNRGAILGDDMGLGKTVQVIGFLAALLGKQGNRVDVMRQKPQFIRKLSDSTAVREESGVKSPFLIIGPGCVLYNWLEELETWGYFTIRKFHGSSKNDCLSDIKKGKVEIVVTTFETFREHQGILNKVDWTAVIADEVHKIKGLKAQTTKALRSISTRRRYGLTGTALQNNLLELWSILDWAQPGCLGRQLDFEQEYVRAIEVGQRHDANKRELAEARKKKVRFAEIRKGMMIRRLKTLIADQLPKKDDNVVFCRLSQLQTSIYKTIMDHPSMDLILHMDDPCCCDSGVPQGKCCKKKTPDGHSVRSLMFTFMHLLLKVANHVAMLIPNNNTSEQQTKMARKICKVALEQHPGFVSQTREASFQTLSNPKYCGKMKILQGLLEVFYKDHSQVLVFSYSTQALDIIEQYLMSTGYEYRRIDGSVSAKKRQIIVREFNTDPNIFVCLISTKAGGLGLNLTGANRVIIFDPNWNPTHDLQAQDRAYRIGQRRNVQVYRLVSAGTIEENMYLRQIYKQQLLNVSIEDENARRYFYAVQGNRRQKGELFGVKNMFQLHTGSTCVTMDILKRNERVESALGGYEMTKYIPTVVRLEDDEELEDVLPQQEDELESEDMFDQFFSSQETKDDDQMLDDEIDGDLHHSDDEDISNSSEDQDSDYSEKFHRNCGKRKQIPRNNQTRRERSSDRKVKNDIDLMDELDMMEGEQNIENKKNASRNVGQRKPAFQSPEPYRNNATKKGKEVPSDTKSGKKKVAFQCQEPYRNNVTKKGNEIGSDGDGVKRRVAFQSPELFDVTRKGKVIPSESKTGKGPAKKGSSDKVDDGGEGFFRIDQTLAGSFSDVGDVFENCGVVHIHENVKVVGGSRAEDHMSKCAMTDVYELHQNSQDLAVQCDPLSEVGGSRAEDHMSKCAMTDVYELHQNSQDLAVQCDPLSESSEEELPPPPSKKTPLEDHNTSRSTVVDNMKVLIGQTPKGIRLKQFEKMRQERKAENLTDFAEMVLRMTEDERIDLLNKHYQRKEPSLKDILIVPQLSVSREPLSSSKKSQAKQLKQRRAARRTPKKRSRAAEQSLGGIAYEDLVDSESLPQPISDQELQSDEESSLDIGIKVTPAKRRKVPNQSRTKPKKVTPHKGNNHVPIPPSYLDCSISDEDGAESFVFRAKTKKKENERDKTAGITENQLECIGDAAGEDSVDSADLWSQMGKMSQAEVDKNVPKLSSCDSVSDSYAAHSNTERAKHRLGNKCESVIRTRSDNQRTGRVKGIDNIDKNRQNLSDKLDRRKECKNNDMNLKLESATGIDERTRKEKPGTSNQIVNASKRCIDNLGTSTSKRKHSNYIKADITEKLDDSQGSVLDDLFGKSGGGNKTKRKPAPSKHKTVKHSIVKTVSEETTADKAGGDRFKEIDNIFCSTDSDSDVRLETSTLKDDDYDCFDDPRNWKKRKQKPEKEPVSAIDKLISDSEADFNNLFTMGKMKRKEKASIQVEEDSSVKACDGSRSLFSY